MAYRITVWYGTVQYGTVRHVQYVQHVQHVQYA